MIQPGAVFEGVKRLWDGSALTAYVAGGLWEGPPSHGAGSDGDAYASAGITEGEAIWDSAIVIQSFTLTLTVWSTGGAVRADRINRALDRTFGRGRTVRLTVPGATRILDVRPVPGEFNTDPLRRDAKDVKVAARRWEILTEATP